MKIDAFRDPISRAKNSPLTPSPARLPLLRLAASPSLLLEMEMDLLAGWQAACLAGWEPSNGSV